MNKFAGIMSDLRRAKGLPQRQVAADLKISQALLSHYENGAREPGIDFICRACRYYGVTADYMLGLSDSPSGNEQYIRKLEDVLLGLRQLCDSTELAIKEVGG